MPQSSGTTTDFYCRELCESSEKRFLNKVLSGNISPQTFTYSKSTIQSYQ